MNGPCFVTRQRVIDLIELGFNDTSTFVGHFVRLLEKGRREIGDSRGERKMNESEETKNIPPLPLPSARIAGLAQL